MTRTTKKDVEAAFDRLLEAIGGKRATSCSDVGGYRLNHNSCYGGWVIEQVTNESGGVDCPFGHRRMPATEFCVAVYFACRAIEQEHTHRRLEIRFNDGRRITS